MTIKKLAVTAAAMAAMATAAVPAYAQDQAAAPNAAQQQDRTATLSFEVKTDCAPPQGTTLLGFVPAEGLISAVLSDPDGDGIFTGSVEVPRFAPGPAPVGTEPVSVPVLVGENVGDDSGNIETIKDFGQVKLDGDKAFSADASFCGTGPDQYGSGGPATDPPLGAEPTVSFEVKTDCAPPADTKLFGGASQQAAALTDPDGDGVYTGSLTLPDGFYDLGAFPVPVSIQAGTPEVPNQQTIKNFGEKVLEDGDHFSASASFCGGDSGSSNTGVGGGTTAMGAGGNSVSGAEQASGNAAAVSGDTNDVGKGGIAATAANVLPSTGGLALSVAGALGALLLAGGMLVRRIFR